jgi:integrase
MSSLQVRHKAGCASGKGWQKAEAVKGSGCDCSPALYVTTKLGGKIRHERVRGSMKEAQVALRKISHQVDEQTYTPPRRVRFSEWADRWVAGLQRKPSTIESYTSTVSIAKAAFGHKPVRDVSPDDVRRLLQTMGHLTASTRAKHLRVLSACFAAAIDSGYTGRNVVKLLSKAERPRAAHREAGFFLDSEVAAFLQATPTDTFFGVFFRTALATGCRLGELAALEWRDVGLIDGVVRVRRSVTHGIPGVPKSHQSRSVDLPGETVELLGRWWGIMGEPDDDSLVFPSPFAPFVSQKMAANALKRALKAGGVDQQDSAGTKRTTHSLRHTHAKLCIEQGCSMTWLSRRLGHQSIVITDSVYGHIESGARKREASKLDGIFAQ